MFKEKIENLYPVGSLAGQETLQRLKTEQYVRFKRPSGST